VILSSGLSSPDAMELRNCDVVNTVEVRTASNSLSGRTGSPTSL
jgi:hypothetical protein